MYSVKNKYFAAANTTHGFVSYYDQCFGGLDRIYVIKGGSGTGKSRLMRELGDSAEGRGGDVEYFFCSFDPDSLDGIIINEKTAVIDGTAPHVYEPRLPGARDLIVDLGLFWNSEVLYSKRTMIDGLSKEKKRHFDVAYSYLEAAGNLTDTNRKIAQKYIKRNKIDSKIITEALSEGNIVSDPKTRIRSSFGRKGLVEFNTYERLSADRLTVSDEYGTFLSGAFLRPILSEGREKGTLEAVSYSPLETDSPDALMFSNGTAVALCEKNGSIDISELLCGEIGCEKERLSGNCLLRTELLRLAEEQLATAARIHSEIESIYISAMDFALKEKYAAELAQNIKY